MLKSGDDIGFIRLRSMSTGPETTEFDLRFPTGEWTGFFIQPDSRRRHAMELFLRFAVDKISGAGRDRIAEFSISGDYNTSTGGCCWRKQYVQMHRVIYSGQATSGGIIGQCQIPGNPEFWTGPFFIWPRSAGDLTAEFERAFLEQEMSWRQEIIWEPPAVSIAPDAAPHRTEPPGLL